MELIPFFPLYIVSFFVGEVAVEFRIVFAYDDSQPSA